MILGAIRDQGKLTEDPEGKIGGAATKAELEDIYLSYKPKRRTRAMIARENGLGPLAEAILADRATPPTDMAQAYLTEAVADTKAALDGARDILTEELSENSDLLGRLREHMKAQATLDRPRGRRQRGVRR